MSPLDLHVNPTGIVYQPEAPALVRCYQPLQGPKDAAWPRATVRPGHLGKGTAEWWAVKVWAAPGVPLRRNGRLVGGGYLDRDQAFRLAQQWVEAARPKVESPAGEPPC